MSHTIADACAAVSEVLQKLLRCLGGGITRGDAGIALAFSMRVYLGYITQGCAGCALVGCNEPTAKVPLYPYTLPVFSSIRDPPRLEKGNHRHAIPVVVARHASSTGMSHAQTGGVGPPFYSCIDLGESTTASRENANAVSMRICLLPKIQVVPHSSRSSSSLLSGRHKKPAV